MSSAPLPPFAPSATEYSASPNPNWKYGQKPDVTAAGRAWVDGEKAGWKVIDVSTEDPAQLYKLVISGIVPRPVAFVSTISETGVANLAPYSWFNQVSPRPLVISISSTMGSRSRTKDTAINIAATRGFVVSMISEPWIESANSACIDAPPGIGEWPLSGLTQAPSIYVKAPRVKESAFSMECELLQSVDVVDPATGKPTTTVFLGLVKYIHVRNDVLTESGTVDPALLRPVVRLGDTTYGRLGGLFRLPFPAWADEEEKMQDLVGNVATKA